MMEPRKHARSWILAVTIASLLVVVPVLGWAQEAPASSDSGSGPSGRTILAGVGAVIGSIFYAPFKGLIMCPAVGLVAGGVTYVATGGEKETPDYLLRLGCSGTYFVSPSMIQGQESFRAYDAP
jgi:hypothetical protein